MKSTCCVSIAGSVALILGICLVSGCEPDVPEPDAFDALIEACDAGKAETCATVADAFATGKQVGQDQQLAAQYIKRTLALATQNCDAGWTETSGCLMLGRIYLEGIGVHRDEQRGLAYLWKGCAGGDLRACEYLEQAGYFPADENADHAKRTRSEGPSNRSHSIPS